MVRGLDTFKKYFELYSANYVIIGGTACDVIIRESGFKPRATRDIDIILVVEALNKNFVKHFWNFIHDGKYEVREKSDVERQYYRFMKPENNDFPIQIELFSRIPDILDISDISRYTPIPVDENITSLSAILMNEDYYSFTVSQSITQDGIKIANLETLICLKARAYIDLKNAKENGENIDSDKINKHRTDIFRLAIFLTDESITELPKSIKLDMQIFADTIKTNLPDKAIFKEMQAGNIDAENVFSQLLKSFNLKS